MKNGMTLQELATTISGMRHAKKDYVADTRRLEFTPEGLLALETPANGRREYKPTQLCLEQIGSRVGIPGKYLERMAQVAPGLLATNVNHWFKTDPERRMIRTLDNGTRIARAFLSERYRPLDYYDMAQAVLPHLAASGCEIKSCDITERKLYVQAVTPSVQAVVQTTRNVGDIVQAGIVISNSEVGCGAVLVEPIVFTLACKNGMIVQKALRRHHVGRAGDGSMGGDDETYETFSDETRRLDDRAFWAKVNDVTVAALDQTRFNGTVKKLQAAAAVDLGNPIDVVEITAEKFGLKDYEKDSVLEHLTRGGDLTKYGLLNAITRAAEDAEKYDRAVELERLGGTVLELPASTWDTN